MPKKAKDKNGYEAFMPPYINALAIRKKNKRSRDISLYKAL